MSRHPKENKQLRSFARVSGLSGLLVYLVYLFAFLFPEMLAAEDNPKLTDDASLLGFLALGYLFAWHRAYEGGIMLMFISAVAGISYYYSETTLHVGIILAVCIPLFLSGLLFYLYHRNRPKQFNELE
ncbi:MAG TPA: hypothetical protein VK994_07255 [Bacteroidales bacterium]|nr:hypothetical protein [Bacteroidales bacterium]